MMTNTNEVTATCTPEVADFLDPNGSLRMGGLLKVVEDKSGPYYVSVIRDKGDYRLLAGPYDEHGAALADVDKVRKIAEEVDSRAVWYAFGTCRITDSSFAEPGILNKRGLM